VEMLGTRVAEGGGTEEPDDTVDPREVVALAVDRAVRRAGMDGMASTE